MRYFKEAVLEKTAYVPFDLCRSDGARRCRADIYNDLIQTCARGVVAACLEDSQEEILVKMRGAA